MELTLASWKSQRETFDDAKGCLVCYSFCGICDTGADRLTEDNRETGNIVNFSSWVPVDNCCLPFHLLRKLESLEDLHVHNAHMRSCLQGDEQWIGYECHHRRGIKLDALKTFSIWDGPFCHYAVRELVDWVKKKPSYVCLDFLDVLQPGSTLGSVLNICRYPELKTLKSWYRLVEEDRNPVSFGYFGSTTTAKTGDFVRLMKGSQTNVHHMKLSEVDLLSCLNHRCKKCCIMLSDKTVPYRSVIDVSVLQRFFVQILEGHL